MEKEDKEKSNNAPSSLLLQKSGEGQLSPLTSDLIEFIKELWVSYSNLDVVKKEIWRQRGIEVEKEEIERIVHSLHLETVRKEKKRGEGVEGISKAVMWDLYLLYKETAERVRNLDGEERDREWRKLMDVVDRITRIDKGSNGGVEVNIDMRGLVNEMLERAKSV